MPSNMGDYADDAQSRFSLLENPLEDNLGDEFGLNDRPQTREKDTESRGKSKNEQGGLPPSWSELKTKAGKDRKRLPLACIACRRKKIRCSGEKPSCKHCLRSRIPCVYKVTTRKAAPRTDYMAMMDKRMKRMEDRILKAIPKTDQEPASSVARANVKPTIPGSQSTTKPAARKRGAVEISGTDLEAWAQSQPRNFTLEGDEDPHMALKARETEESELFRDGAEALPSKQLQEHLSEVFFDNIYGQAYFLLHKPSYMRKLKSDTLPPVLILSVCAVSARFATSPHFKPSAKQFSRGEEWASRAREICTRRSDWPNLTILTCLLLLGLHEMGTCQGGRSWSLGGQAIRMAFALHLHKDLDYDPMTRGKTKLSFVDREIRRRLMWACFLMDRFCSSGTDRPIFIREDAIKIPLPVKERLFQFDIRAPTEMLDGSQPPATTVDNSHLASMQENMGNAAYITRAVALFGRITTYVNQGGRDKDPYPFWSDQSEFAKLARESENLLNLLPKHLVYSLDNLKVYQTENVANCYLLLHVAAQQNVLFVNRAGLMYQSGQPGQQNPPEFMSQASTKAFSAANRISEIIRDAENLQCSITAPFAGYCVFSATTVHILGIFSGNPSLKKTSELCAGINIRYLTKMARYWGMFHWMVENIRSMFRKATGASRAGQILNPADQSAWVLHYGDWFDYYPYGVSEGDSTPAVVEEHEKGASAAVLEQKPVLQSVEELLTPTPAPASGSTSKKPTAPTAEPSSGSTPKRRNTGNKQSGRQAKAPRQPKPSIKTTPQIAPSKPEVVPLKPAARRTASIRSDHVSTPTTPSFPGPGNSSNQSSYSMSPTNVNAPAPPGFKAYAATPRQSAIYHGEQLQMDPSHPHEGVTQQQQQHHQQQQQQPLFDPGYTMNANVGANQPLMSNSQGWGSVLPANVSHGGPVHDPSPMNMNMAGSQQHVQGHVPQEMMTEYADQDPSLGWYVPYSVEQPDMNMDPNQDHARQEFVPNMMNDGGDVGSMPPGMFSVGI